MALTYPQDTEMAMEMCTRKLHHWHLSGKRVECCRCDATQPYKGQISEGPHDDRGDK